MNVARTSGLGECATNTAIGFFEKPTLDSDRADNLPADHAGGLVGISSRRVFCSRPRGDVFTSVASA